MKRVCLVTVIALLLLLPGCGYGSYQVFNDITGDTYPHGDRYAAGDFTYAAGDVDAVEIVWRIGSVELIESDGDTLSVTESGKDLDGNTQMRHWLDGRTLRIQFCQSGANVHVKSADKALTVELPKGIALSVYNTAAHIHAETLEQGSVFLSSFSGNLDCGTLTADQVDVSSSSGEIHLGQVEGDALKLSTTSGHVTVESAVLTGPLACSSVSGRVNVNSLTASTAAIDTTSGAVTLGGPDCPAVNVTSTSGAVRLSLPEDGAKVAFQTVSGSLKASRPYETLGGLLVFGEGGSEVRVVTTSGSLELE